MDHGPDPDLQAPAHPGDGHETTDISLRPLILFVFGLVGSMTLVFLIVRGQFSLYEDRQSPGQEPIGPLPGLERQPTSEPRLQEAPAIDMERLRQQDLARLTSEGWVDKNAGIARISIDDAMRILAAKGLPARKGPPDDRPPGATGSLPFSRVAKEVAP